MARLEFFVVAESVAIDLATNRLSVFNVLEELRSEEFPKAIAECAAVSLWRAEERDRERDWQVTLRVSSPGGTSHEFTNNFRFVASRQRVTQRIRGLPIEQEGELRFEVLLNGKHVAEHVVTVSKVESIDVAIEPVVRNEESGIGDN